MVVVLSGVGALFLSLRHAARIREEAQARLDKAHAGPLVEVAQVKRTEPSRQVDVIGEARPYLSDNLFARVSGYVKEVRFDKGDEVTEGQVLAVVESPETDKAYLAALADARNKQLIAQRYRKLLKQRLVAPQDEQIAVATADIAQAVLETQAVLKGYEEVRAPFDGVITSRLVDPGNLLQNATNSQSSAQLLATMSYVDELRVYAFVDQKDAAWVHPGDDAEIRLDERPDFVMNASVSRISSELDSKTRKMLTEIDIPNTERQIVSGSFVKVRLHLVTDSYLKVPVKALVMRDRKPFVPIVTSGDTLHLQPIHIVDNDGQTLVVDQGLREGESVALDVGNSLGEGARVRTRQEAAVLHEAPPYPAAPAPNITSPGSPPPQKPAAKEPH